MSEKLGSNKAIFLDRTSRCRDTSEVGNSCCLYLRGQMDVVESVSVLDGRAQRKF